VCNACVASEALDAGACLSNCNARCKTARIGHIIDWRDGGARGIPKKMQKCVPFRVAVRARGKGAEFRSAEYQVRRPGSRWSKWRKTKDLAGAMGDLGLDKPWPLVPTPMKDYVHNRRRSPPTEAEIERWRKGPGYKAWTNEVDRYMAASITKKGRKVMLSRVERGLRDPRKRRALRKVIREGTPLRIVKTARSLGLG